MAEKFWGKTFGTIAKTITLPFAVGNGLVKMVTGDGFEKGFDNIYEEAKSTIDEVEEWGDKNNNGINTGLTSAASIVVIIASGGKHKNLK
jgi:hypothetical protein